MFEIRVLIPTADNNGTIFLPSHHVQFEMYLAERFSGFTRYGAAGGGWVDSSRLYKDETAIYAVAISSIQDFTKVLALIDFIKIHYSQLKVYVSYLGQTEII